MSKINSWEDQLNQFKQLSLNNAKDLYREYVETCDNEKRDMLIMGTLNIATKSAKEYAKELGSKYDTQDVIDLTVEYYIREVNKGRLLEIKKFNELFNDEYKAFINSNLVPKAIEVPIEDTPLITRDVSDSVIERIDREKLEEYADEVIRSLTAPESTALVASNSNVPMVVEKKKSYPLTTRGYSSVVIMGIITGIICIGIIILGVYLVI